MKKRDIEKYIKSKYDMLHDKRICLLCSEEKPDKCHRSLIAQYFKELYGKDIIHL